MLNEKTAGQIRFQGALWVSQVLKALAVLSVVGGFIYAIQGPST